MRWHEFNFDGLVGPTHNYAGLSFGNIASTAHQGALSHPKQAALQGLSKMRWLMDRGFGQGILPPQLRPDIPALRRLGFRGSAQKVLAQAWDQAPDLFAMCCSASSMWVANAATVIPSCDNSDQRCVLIPANLVSHVHRNIEVEHTAALLNFIFSDDSRFRVERPLPAVAEFADEGAANHMRIVLPGQPALHIFVFGQTRSTDDGPTRYPARQAREACAALARLGGLSHQQYMLIQQHPDAIDGGVFHNDVIAVSHDGILLCHASAFVNQSAVLAELKRRTHDKIKIVEVAEADISMATAVNTYLFNSQILGGEANRTLLLPIECERDIKVKQYVESRLRTELALQEIAYLDLQQSMRNGGGPACLRLRINLNEQEQSALQGSLLLTDELYGRVTELVEARYPETLSLAQLSEWSFAKEMYSIVKDVHRLLGLPLELEGFE